MRLILARLLWTFELEVPQEEEKQGALGMWEEQKTWILWEKVPLRVRLRVREDAC